MSPRSRLLAGALAHQRIEIEDTAVAALRFKNGALGVIEAATSAYPRYPEAARDPRRSRVGAGRIQDDLDPLGFSRERCPATTRFTPPWPVRRASRLRRPATTRHHPHRKHRDQLIDFLQAIDAVVALRRSTGGRDERRSRSSGRFTCRMRTGKHVELPRRSLGMTASSRAIATQTTVVERPISSGSRIYSSDFRVWP